MNPLCLIALASFLAGTCLASAAPERPNILWLTFEDSSAYELGCYGNVNAKTPVIDGLAAQGLRYTNAWSNAPQCSPARSTLISGSYSTTFGTDLHRHEYPIPEDIYFFPKLLRQAGYFCTNNAKTDYNCPPAQRKGVWDRSDNKASYNNPERRPGQPFFAVFNSDMTHMGRVRSWHLDGRRDFGREGLAPASLALPPHVPDLPEIRSDYAFHLEGIQDMDKWVGFFIKDLAAKGLAEDTIIIVNSDHGGCLPRGKAFIFESGLRIPLIIHAPRKWRQRLGFEPGAVSDRLVGFVDFAPTFLSILDLPIPDYMQGRAFLGPRQTAPRDYQFAYRANQDDHFDPYRAVTDGRYKYIQYFIRNKPFSARGPYQWGMPANAAWDRAQLAGTIEKPEHLANYGPKPLEMLFDLQVDPYEIKNLAADPAFAGHKQRLAARLRQHLLESKDLGFIPPSQRDKPDGLYRWTRAHPYDFAALIDVAQLASRAQLAEEPALVAALQSPQPEIRYWAAIGLGNIDQSTLDARTRELLSSAAADHDLFAAAAANAALIYRVKDSAAVANLIGQMAGNSEEAYSHLEALTQMPTHRGLLLPHEARLRQLASAKGENLARQARSLLVNLHLLDYAKLYPASTYDEGVKVNEERRSLIPRP